MNVIVAVWEHKYGEDIRVFDSEEKALAWKDEIALTWWVEEFPDDDRPKEKVGEEYFDRMSERAQEWFYHTTHEVE